MEPVMKIVDSGGRTHYIFHPERVLEIRDVGKPDKPAAQMFFDSAGEHTNRYDYSIDGITARDLKRNIQENVPDTIGFLKLDYNTDRHGPKARRYLNVDTIVSLQATRINRQVDGQIVQVGGASLRGLGFGLVIEGAPFAIAAQVRRVLKRLDQDEEFCCDAPEPEAESEE